MTETRRLSVLSWIARAALIIGAVCLFVSPKYPFWEMKLDAKQYQRPLTVTAYPNRIEGDVAEIDLLNHYIGMRELEKAAVFERSIGHLSVMILAAVMLLVAVFSFRWSPILLLPVVLFPALFLLDLHWWLRDYGLHLDPHAPMNHSIKPFVPTVLGIGKVGQFKTEAYIGFGMRLVITASVISLVFTIIRWTGWYRRTNPLREDSNSHAIPPVVTALFLTLVVSPSLSAATWDVTSDGPIKTISAAIEQASPGDSIHVHGGVHAGPLVIGKTVNLIGHDNPVIEGHGKGTVVTLSARGIQMSGFHVRGSGDKLANEDGDGGILATAEDIVIENNRLDDVLFGISLRSAHHSQVKQNVLHGKKLDIARRGDLIRLWWSHEVLVEGNEVAAGRDLVLWYSKELTIRHNDVHDGRYGIHFMYCDGARVVDNVFHNNSVGSFLMYSRDVHLERNWIENNRGTSGYGVGLKDMESYTMTDNVIVNNRTAVFMEGADGELKNNWIGYNERGITIFTSCRKNVFSDNSFLENGEQVVVEGNLTLSQGNRWKTNYWSDYRGLDVDRDGIGDQPYRPVQLFERLADRNSGMKLFSHGTAAEAIDYAASLFPVFEPRTKFTDPHPRVASLAPPLTRALKFNWAFLPLGGGLLIGVAACLTDWSTMPFRVATLKPSGGCKPLESALNRESARKYSPHPSMNGQTMSNLDPSTTPIAVKVSGLSKRFGRVNVLKNINFEIRAGEAVALWGPNGAGKTTLIRCLLGVIPSEGACEILGYKCGLRGKESRRRLGYVPQEVKLRGDHTVIGCVRFFSALRGIPVQRGISLLEEWGLGQVHQRAVNHLSGGMLQKLGLVLALLSDPPVLLLDEPTSNLDVTAREEFGRLLARLKAAGKTLLFCTHRSGEILSLADRVVVLKEGTVAAVGTPNELRDQLLKPAVLRLIVATEQREAAVETLQSQGFHVRADGGEIWLDVPGGRKSEAILHLENRGIKVFDFDVESDRGFQG